MIKEMIVRPTNEIYDEPLIIPVSIPSYTQVYDLAFSLHRQGQPYTGRAFGWDIQYWPAQELPACFIIGESSIWSISFDWENGDEAPPIITQMEQNIVENEPKPEKVKAGQGE